MPDRVYTVEFADQAVAVGDDLFEITPADDKPVKIVGLHLSQSSDLGDAQEEVIRYRIIRGNTTSGSGGAAPTPQIIQPSGSGPGFTAETCNTTVASGGTPVNLYSGGFNIRVGEQIWFPEGCEPGASQSSTLIVVRMVAAPADSVTLTGTLFVLEQG